MTHSAKQAIIQAKAVLFDFDGVILDSEWPIYQTWLKLFQREGHDLPPEVYVKCIGSDFDTWSPEIHLENLTGKKFDWETENAERQVEILRALKNPVAMPGAAELAYSLQEKSTAVVSSSSHSWVDGWLKKLELMHCFNTIVCRGDAPKIKPAPDLYIEAAQRLEINPSDCIVIEDSLNGMLSAHSAGMQVIAIPNRLTSVLDFSAADWSVNALSDLV
jgi:putative hydrolase of the HAD superfamily